MPVFNVGFLNPKTKKASGTAGQATILSNQLSMLEHDLAKDGFLAPGDYDILIEKAQQLRTTGGLTPAQQSKYDVKIVGYEKAKNIKKLEKDDDIERMKVYRKSEGAEDVMMAGNKPEEFLRGRLASLRAGMDDLSESIERREAAGQESSEHWNELMDLQKQYTANFKTLSSMSEFDGNNPIVGQVAFVSTNSDGEIVNVDYAKHGSKTGYAETNGMINGFQVYGKINTKREGKNLFVLGDQVFSAPDLMIPDPSIPGSFKPNKLVAGVEQRGPLDVGQPGFVNMPGETLTVQGHVPRDSWVQGMGNAIYKRREDGNFSKYLNVQNSSDIDGAPERDGMLTLPNSMEQSIVDRVDRTIDFANPISPEQGPQTAPLGEPVEIEGPATSAEAPMTAAPQPRQPARRGGATRTKKKPEERASHGVIETAKRTVQSGVEYLQNIFR